MRTSSAKTADSALSRSCARVPASESAHPAGQRLDRGVWVVASVVILGAVMSLLDTTIVNVALATLARDLPAPVATIQWVSAGYLVSLALARWPTSTPAAPGQRRSHVHRRHRRRLPVGQVPLQPPTRRLTHPVTSDPVMMSAWPLQAQQHAYPGHGSVPGHALC